MSADRLRDAYRRLVDWQQFYENHANRARARTEEAETERRALAEQQATLAEQLAVAEVSQAEAEERLAAVRGRQAELARREAAVQAREEEADAGFLSKADQARSELAQELAARRTTAKDELAKLEAALRQDHADRQQRLERDRVAINASVKAQQDALAERWRDVEARSLLVEKEQDSVKAGRIRLDRREQAMNVEIAAHAAAQVTQLDAELRKAHAEAEANRVTVERLTEQLTEIQSRWQALGVDDPVPMLDELDALKRKNRELHDKLAARLDDDTLERLRRLEEQNHELHTERERLTYEVEDLRGKVLFSKIHHLQVNQLAEAERQFDAITRGYEKRITELEHRWDTLHEETPDLTKPLFPNCVGMDNADWLQETGQLIDEPPDLAVLARNLQWAMFRQSDRKYRLEDVCSVLGGMAMSQLHLLQGMSGIGKTSLPIALARALHTMCTVIEVQAGWRDRSDLFGSHNTFEGRFEESPFLQALYRAQTPRYRHRPYVIVLDEMNLSRPEQYFSVILSKVETGDDEPVQLVSTGQGHAPREMAPDGTSITVPRNVWFVGTANHDESTLEFADKTYNRSYVLELPTERPWIRQRRGKVEPYSLKALRAAFDHAGQEHAGELDRVRSFLADVSPGLDTIGGIAVGPRMEDQLNTYVPVVIATRPTAEPAPRDNGAEDGEASAYSRSDKAAAAALAVDHFFATKVLRQLSGKFEVTSDRIERLELQLLEHWEKHFRGDPTQCERLLAIEKRRRDA